MSVARRGLSYARDAGDLDGRRGRREPRVHGEGEGLVGQPAGPVVGLLVVGGLVFAQLVGFAGGREVECVGGDAGLFEGDFGGEAGEHDALLGGGRGLLMRDARLVRNL